MDNFHSPSNTPMSTHSNANGQQEEGGVLLCASCDRCRARKTKCDGMRPCENCKNKLKKTKKLDSVEGIDIAEFDCIYSPAKRRGPVPGKSATRKADQMLSYSSPDNCVFNNMGNMGGQYQPQVGFDGTTLSSGGFNPQQQQYANSSSAQFSAEELKQMLLLQQQLLMQQQEMQQQQQTQQQGIFQQLVNVAGAGGGGNIGLGQNIGHNQGQQQQQFDNQFGGGNIGSMNLNGDNGMMGGGMNNVGSMDSTGMVNNGQIDQPQAQLLLQQYQNQLNIIAGSNTGSSGHGVTPTHPSPMPSQQYVQEQQPAKRAHRVDTAPSDNSGLPKSVASHLPLLDRHNADGNVLRAYYDLSVNDVLNLPPIPSDEEYCGRLALNNYHCMPNNLPTYDHSALQAARFAELALGALANNQVPLALELSNASVMCMRNCCEEPSDESCMYEVARAYLLHGIFRSFRGDFLRYFKYRRVCMTHVGQLADMPHVDALIAAVSFHDALAYMLHNASEDALPDIDQVLPRFNPRNSAFDESGEVEAKYGISTNAKSVASNPNNQMWIQGAPPVFLNNEANLANRSLDGLACAIRACCDHANSQFEQMAKEAGADIVAGGSCGMSATTRAVMANESELCSRNIVISARTLLDQHSAASHEKAKKHGLEMVGLAMDAFLENSGEQDGMGGFTDKQIKNFLTVCDTVIKNPLLLHAPGPVYHMASNAAIMLCHLLNGMHANCGEGSNAAGKSGIEEVLFDEVLDSFMAVRKLLNGHRKSLPVKLRCHGIPRPNVGRFKKSDPEAPFVDLGETLMCACRGCQGFVLMGCSPCVAAERTAAASKAQYNSGGGANGNYNEEEFERELQDMGEFDMGDDALLSVLSRFVQN